MINILGFLSNAWPYVVAILMFLVLIFIHELGHFIAAKATGVRVNEFAIGFGPTIFKKTRGETTYFVKALPFGGYCAMEGEDEESGDERAFCNKPAWKRAIVVAMGAIFNLILGLILVVITLIPQKEFLSTRIEQFSEEAVSNELLKSGDKIVEVNGRRVYTTDDLAYAFTGVEGGKLTMVVERDGEKVSLKDVPFKTNEIEGIEYVEVDFYVQTTKKTFGSFISQTFLTAISQARVIWFSLIDLLSGKYGISAMSGPVGVTVVIGSAAKHSIMSALSIMVMLTINLGIFNLLPVPALDGGRLVFILIEMITKKRVPQKIEGAIHTIGFILLMLLMVSITAKDIISLVV